MDSMIKITKGCAEVRVNPKIYSKETIFAAAYVFLDKAYIMVDEDKGKIIVYISAQDKNTDPRRLALDFSNELLNYAHYFSRTKNNAEAIKTIMQRALFSAAPSLVKEAEDKEIQDLIKELEEEEKQEEHAAVNKKGKK